MPSQPSRKELFETSLVGTSERPPIPHLQSDLSPSWKHVPRSLEEYRVQESRADREARIRFLWRQLPHLRSHKIPLDIPIPEHPKLSAQEAEELRKIYARELLLQCESVGGASSTHGVDWYTFLSYVDQKEEELWNVFHRELDLDGDGHLDASELRHALQKAGVEISSATLDSFLSFLSVLPHPRSISFPEFRDFYLLLPRKATAEEILHYYEVRRYMGDDGRGPARVNMEGDVTLIAHDRPQSGQLLKSPTPQDTPNTYPAADHSSAEVQRSDKGQADQDDVHRHPWFGGNTAAKFLLAGGIAGAVSRTATAPFDRLKVFLITQPPDLPVHTKNDARLVLGARTLFTAVGRLYSEGGLLAFWVGNGLNVVKIFPESAIKFFAYESSKRFFAAYWDDVDDARNISGTSRFISGGIGGITSQLSIYPIETLKTQMQSTSGEPKRSVMAAARRLWALGGVKAYYRGLVVGLVGVFPYSAIDMSTFEALKLAYLRSVGEKEPGVLATLAFGSISGSVGATSVYPLNLVRTRLQASGSSGHPQRYTGFMDVTMQTFEKEGVRGFYRGLVPTLAKVVPAVSISYLVYEQCKKRLGVAG